MIPIWKQQELSIRQKSKIGNQEQVCRARKYLFVIYSYIQWACELSGGKIPAMIKVRHMS